jgi:hypothetical protein
MKFRNETGGTVVIFSKAEILDFLWACNPDKSKANENYVANMRSMIESVTDTGRSFSVKQYQWVLSKIRFILKRNKSFKLGNLNIKGFEVCP